MFDVDENADRNGMALYFMTFFVALIVWFWKKYL
jgi:hypothetical protein